VRLGVISVRGPDFHPNRRLAQAAAARGHELVLLHPFRAWPALGGPGPELLSQPAAAGLAAVLPRLGATVSDYSLALISHLELMGLTVINRAAAIRLASHKYLTLQTLAAAGLPVPETMLVNRPSGWGPALERLGGYPVVLKLARGRQGQGVCLLKGAGQAQWAQELLLRQRQGLLLQRFHPPSGRRDLRVLVVGGRAAAAVSLTPAPGEFRSNVHLGGAARALEPTGEPARLALAACQALGLEIAGLDLMDTPAGLLLLEANYSPGFQGLEQATGLDVAGLLLDHAAARARGASPL